jgi:hypothetical protein
MESKNGTEMPFHLLTLEAALQMILSIGKNS